MQFSVINYFIYVQKKKRFPSFLDYKKVDLLHCGCIQTAPTTSPKLKIETLRPKDSFQTKNRIDISISEMESC